MPAPSLKVSPFVFTAQPHPTPTGEFFLAPSWEHLELSHHQPSLPEG